jgi:AcrR family transcriptional regulator
MTSLTETREPIRRGGRGARKRILNAASERFYLEGINAAGVGRIACEASVSNRTLYRHCPSNMQLGLTYAMAARGRLTTTCEASFRRGCRRQNRVVDRRRRNCDDGLLGAARDI